ncbi:sulfatase-like hydrolase/transferase [Akkermansiaceae bacterium]|nr:sulfatase-like hydrolase/transferase [Akkermansiaceae bacterium]
MKLLIVLILLTGLVSAQQADDLYRQGAEKFFAGQVKEAIVDWDREIAMVPRRGPHHWQRGLALYYAAEYDKGVEQFVSHQTVNGHDVENAVWHFLCVVRGTDGSVEKARKNLIPIEGDSRVPMKEVHDLFSGKGTAKEVLEAASKNADGLRLRNQLCYAHLYLGLYFEALGETKKAAMHIKKSAVDFRMDHYMGMVAQLHHKLRARPNIIFLFADDQRADTIGAHGNPHILTPNLDKLATEGMSFRQNYCAGSFSGAVCVASRAMLMTGRHWMSLPRENPQSNWGDSVILPAHLEKEGGYRSHIVGKWHNGQGTLNKSFRSGRAIYMGGMADHTSFQVQDLQEGKLQPKRDAGGFSSTVFADAAIEFIEKADGEQPFFLYVAFMAPHDPRNPPEKYREIYYNKRPPLPPNFLPQHPFQNAPASTSGRDEGLAPWPRIREVISDQLCEYYGLVTHLDEQVGRIMKALEGTPHADNTYIVYTADHGLAMGSHGLLGKQNVYEQSMKCPLIIKGPDIPKGESSEAYTYVHDLNATVCGFAKVAVPEKSDSRDLRPVIRGEVEKVHDSVFLPFQNNQRTVRDERWKLHLYPLINHRLLFDLKEDPHETKNLAEDPAHAQNLASMIAMMESSRKSHGDWYPLSVENPKSKEPSYDNAKRTLDIWQPKWIRDKYFGGRSRTDHGKR